MCYNYWWRGIAMKTYICPLVLIGFLCAGCGVELLATTAIRGELEAEQAGALKRQVGNAANSTGKVNIQRNIDLYAAENGHYPASLEDLVPRYMTRIPTRADGAPYNYDPSTGKLVDGPVAPQPTGVTAGDRQKMNQIRAAIHRYGMAVGYYPPSLQALAPTYLAAVPKTDSGQDFVFHPQNGALFHPIELAGQTPPQSAPGYQAPTTPPAQPPRPAGAPVGGGGPMAEVVTGMGVQKQLNSMSNAGSSSAGGYGRRKLRGATKDRNKQQEKAMDDLGL